MRDAVTGVEYYSCGAARSIEGEDGLYGGVKGRNIESFEENLGSCVAICAGIERRLGEKDRVLQPSENSVGQPLAILVVLQKVGHYVEGHPTSSLSVFSSS